MSIAKLIMANTSMIKDKKVYYVLWTGGWDSTFRIVELSRTDCVIQPVYVLDHKRNSIQYEQKAMASITTRLRQKKETKAELLDLIVIPIRDIPQDEMITNAYRIIHEKTGLGSQHDWLARLGKLMPGMEMGTEAGEPETSHIIKAIQQYCYLEIQDGIGKIVPDKSSKEGRLVLGWFTFPIIDKYEVDMLSLIHKWNYEDVMKEIWFCHTPYHGKPCGFCHPCEVKMESRMEWLLPKSAQKKYYHYKKIATVLGVNAANKYKQFFYIFDSFYK